jgi:hypothetical protein
MFLMRQSSYVDVMYPTLPHHTYFAVDPMALPIDSVLGFSQRHRISTTPADGAPARRAAQSFRLAPMARTKLRKAATICGDWVIP